MELNKDKLKARIAEAWAEAKKCNAAFFNCCYQDTAVNNMLTKHATLLDYLGNQLWRHMECFEEVTKELDTVKEELSHKEQEVNELRGLLGDKQQQQEKEKQK